MRQPEQLLWDVFKDNRPSNVWLQRIENSAKVGMPDVYAARRPDDKASWIELKAVVHPSHLDGKPRWRHSPTTTQINWHLRAKEFGVHSSFLIRDDRRNLYLVPGIEASIVDLLTQHELNAFHVVDWDMLFARLFV